LARIGRGELMALKHEETGDGPKAVDVKKVAKEFEKAGVWCGEYGGVLYGKTGNAHEVSEGNTRVLEACEGGWAPVGMRGGVEIEMVSEGAARGLVENVSAGALDDFCAGSRVVPAKRAHGGA